MNLQQRTVLIVSVLASFVAFLDGSVVTVALPAIARELGGGFFIQQWTVDAYLITLGALILIAGSLSDIFGRKRVLYTGLLGFLVTSILCSIAPNGPFLVVARALQGIAGALLVPSSLALIIAEFKGPAQSKAIGTWTAWTGVAYIAGPVLGGFLVDVSSWRLIFAINVLPIMVTVYLMRKLTADNHRASDVRLDVPGAILCALGLGGSVYALIEQARFGWDSPLVYVSLTAGIVSLGLFVWHERRTMAPMLPLGLFHVRNFSIGNIATFAIYGGLAIAVFLITLFIQQVAGYSAVEAGFALLPVTVLMFLLSPYMGALAGKYGPRFFMAAGPIIGGLSFLYLLHADHTAAYWTQIFPAIAGFGIGLSVTVAPLVSAILGSIDTARAGIASAVNNAVARIAGLLAVAALGVVTGPTIDVESFHQGMLFTAILLIGGGVISGIGIQNHPVMHKNRM
jgi:EmrB/QacA subfamily drug resistance transporter